jgi:hypothetical protein
MRLPLIVSGVTRKVTQCAVVRVPQGDWRIIMEGWIDSELHLSPVPSVEHDKRFTINEPLSVQLSILKPGSETNLCVYLEKM